MNDEEDVKNVYGMDLTIAEYDRHEFGIAQKYRKLELELFRMKWFDYRLLHPTQATYLYAHYFDKAYQIMFAKMIDKSAAERVRIQKRVDLFDCAKAYVTSAWRGRQAADALGVPYNVFIRLAFEGALKYWNRSHLPQITQMYSERILDFVCENWIKRCKARLELAEHEHYLAENYTGTWMQDDHHEWIVQQLQGRGARDVILRDIVETRKLMPVEIAEQKFGVSLS